MAEGKSKKILVVDDEFLLLMMVTDVLEDLGYDLVTANSGDAALQLIHAGEQFDLLLTDVMMPGGPSGFELAARTRKLYPNMPIVYLSGYTGFSMDGSDRVKAPLLQKPTCPNVLSQTLTEVLSASA